MTTTEKHTLASLFNMQKRKLQTKEQHTVTLIGAIQIQLSTCNTQIIWGLLIYYKNVLFPENWPTHQIPPP